MKVLWSVIFYCYFTSAVLKSLPAQRNDWGTSNMISVAYLPHFVGLLRAQGEYETSERFWVNIANRHHNLKIYKEQLLTSPQPIQIRWKIEAKLRFTKHNETVFDKDWSSTQPTFFPYFILISVPRYSSYLFRRSAPFRLLSAFYSNPNWNNIVICYDHLVLVHSSHGSFAIDVLPNHQSYQYKANIGRVTKITNSFIMNIPGCFERVSMKRSSTSNIQLIFGNANWTSAIARSIRYWYLYPGH